MTDDMVVGCHREVLMRVSIGLGGGSREAGMQEEEFFMSVMSDVHAAAMGFSK